ncbi:hypothetical protein [Myroides odoratimimus]|uniref:hypothetical protein n=1 Tax=Myroides odoratimimus TaxID=76832 RepID=UPI002574B1D3|nr:hypothetical protein [Myroides odoratimimus]MDM1465153.1 hypothetical protein [Myroides odoratimimus]MDM1475140.1 hypothetical protein [Myroides odoratimimus]
MNHIEEENRKRIQMLLDQTIDSEVPIGWKKKTFAVGGLTEIGFSKEKPNLLLIISSRGRGVVDCQIGELIERDYEEDGDWIDEYNLVAKGIGGISNEIISISGLHGGGLPSCNKNGDSLSVLALNWPIIDIVFAPSYKNLYIERFTKDCFKIFHDYELRAYGFSYDGQTFVIATSSEVNVYRLVN